MVIEKNGALHWRGSSVQQFERKDSMSSCQYGSCPRGRTLLKTDHLTLKFALLVAAVVLAGCRQEEPSGNTVSVDNASNSPTGKEPKQNDRVVAQGRLLPKGGIIELAATPGDRVEKVFVEPGQQVEEGYELVRLASLALYEKELEAAQLQLREAQMQLAAKRHEAELAVSAAKLQEDQATLLLEHARQQSELVQASEAKLTLLNRQLDRLQKMASDPKTAAAVNRTQVEQQQLIVAQADSDFQGAKLAAAQGIKSAELSRELASQQLVNANSQLELVDILNPVEGIEKKIELLQLKLKQAKIVAPISGTILSTSVQPGDSVGQIPLVQMASLEKLVCEAEVHEANVRHVQPGMSASLQSAAFDVPLNGVVTQVGSLVGRPQLRSPDPMDPVDFRSISVMIDLEPSSADRARELVQLQLRVTIFSQRPEETLAVDPNLKK